MPSFSDMKPAEIPRPLEVPQSDVPPADLDELIKPTDIPSAEAGVGHEAGGELSTLDELVTPSDVTDRVDSVPETSEEMEEQEPLVGKLLDEPRRAIPDEVNIPSREDERRLPVEGNLGTWTGDRGNSFFVPFGEEASAVLKRFGIKGIEYVRSIPDFSPCSLYQVEIAMTANRDRGPNSNFNQADRTIAAHFNEIGKDNRTDWKSDDVKQWRKDNKLTWHECSDMKTCQLVPRAIHDSCRHDGGFSECKRLEGMSAGSVFDD